MRWGFTAVLAIVLGGVAVAVRPVAGDELTVITVTSPVDATGSCPSTTTCTLRAAVEAANIAAGTVEIRFSPAVFPAGAPTTIAIGSSGLPPLTKAGAVIDGSDAGVIVQDGSQSVSVPLDGIRLTGAGTAVRGLTVVGFRGACITAAGANSVVGGTGSNELRACGVGVRAAAPGVVVAGNRFIGPTEGPPFGTGVEVSAPSVTVGGIAENSFEQLAAGVRAIASTGPVTGTTIDRNTFTAIDGPCVELGAGTNASTVTNNSFSSCGPAVVVGTATDDHPASERNSIRANSFANLHGLAIDIGGDGRRNSPDSVPANGGIAFPTVQRATVSAIEGLACPGCSVELYLAAHTPGGRSDYGVVRLGHPVTADGAGRFTAELSVSPGQWVTATATDSDGNTSEFGPSARVGAGVIQCGNIRLSPGWNHVGYFGSQPLVLGDTFPGGGGSTVSAIYQAIDGTTSYRRWLAATPAGRTLVALEPGQEYWFLATETTSLAGGFTVSFPVPVELSPGWNDAVYIGGSADPRDAFASLGENLVSVAKWDAETQRWLRYGDGSAPPWAAALTQVESCEVYQLLLSGHATLVPLQP